VARRDPGVDMLVYGVQRPSVDRLAEAFLVDIRFNAAHAHALAEQIAASRTRQRRIAAVLDGLSAFFALVAGVTVARLLRRYLALLDAQITELDLFAARVAHDVRTPLTTAGLAIDRVRQRCREDEQAVATLDRASRSVQHVAQIVEALLALAGAAAPPAKGVKADLRALAA